MIIVNDGSKDDTQKVAAKYAAKIIDSDTGTVQTTDSNFKNIT